MKAPILAILFLLSTSAGATQVSEMVARHLPEPAMVGEAQLKVLFWKVYDARLFAPQGNFQQQQPFALELTYLRDFSGEDIAERSVQEIKNQGFTDRRQLALWQQRMTDLFPDVNKNSRITGVATSQGHTLFYFNDTLLGEIADPLFTRRFFDIWLGEASSDPEFRQQLIGNGR